MQRFLIGQSAESKCDVECRQKDSKSRRMRMAVNQAWIGHGHCHPEHSHGVSLQDLHLRKT